MKTILVMTILLVYSVGSASESNTSDVDVNEQYSEAKRISMEQAQSPEAKEYFGTMASFWQRILSNSARKCLTGPSGGVELILTINEQGVIQDVIGLPWNKKSKCYAKVVVGKKASPPPEHPFFLSTDLP